MSTDLSPIAFRRLEAIGYIPGECNPIAWMLDRLERAAKVKPDDAAALIRRAHDMVRDLCKRRDEPGAREWQMSIPARPDHDPDLVIGAALDAADDLASEVGRLRDALATVTRERDEARADMADVQARYARAWEALCSIGEAIEVAGHPQLLPERALRVGEGVAKIIGERDEARKALATEEHNHELTIARRDDAQSWADSLANQIAEAADHEIGEHSNLNNPWDNAQDGLVKLVRERDELRAALLNERGEGPPPSEGWARNDFDRRAVGIAWYRPSNADGSPPPAGAMDYAYVLWVYREPMEPEWTWECEHADFSSRNIQGKAPTAREAMRAADTALAGAKS